ncbi:unnamed protein product [Scytosiphon promiscuus]
MVMRRHVQKDGRQEGAMVNTNRQRPDGVKRTASKKQLRRLSSQDVPACVVVKSGDGSDAGEVLQHSAFHMEAFRVHSSPRTQAGPGSGGGGGCGRGGGSSSSTTFLFVFHGGQPNQAALEITHTPRRASAGACSLEGMEPPVRLPPSPSNGEGRVTMTLGGKSVPHLPGEPYSCHIRQVGTVTFNPRKQAQGNYLYILSQEGRTLFTALR